MTVQRDLEEAIRVAAQQSSGFYTVYEPKEVIGRGLASVVRRCVEKESKKQYAVKIVDLSTERQSEREAKRLGEETLSEVRLLKLLSGHPSIICLHEFFTTPTFLFAIFELARCELFEALNKSVTFSEKRTRLVMRQLFDGVRYLHSKRIIHRDLKLENILCIDDKRVVVSDFGFAKQLEPDQKLRDLFGTPGYLAPETLRCQMYEDAEGYGLEVDEWALGVIMYTLLAGYAPFYHRQQLRMMRLVQEGRYEFDKEQWESVSEEAKDLIRRLLMVNPAVRISSRECLSHPWMTAGMGVLTSPARMVETPSLRRSLPQLRRLFRVVQHSICFMVRLRNFKQLKLKFDRAELRARPYRSREIRHEAESASFAIYGHWVNRGFYYSRDMLFANKPRPKYVKGGRTNSSRALINSRKLGGIGWALVQRLWGQRQYVQCQQHFRNKCSNSQRNAEEEATSGASQERGKSKSEDFLSVREKQRSRLHWRQRNSWVFVSPSRPKPTASSQVDSEFASSFEVRFIYECAEKSKSRLVLRDGTLSTTVVLIDFDGVQQFSFSFSLEQHCFSFLKSLEGALGPLFKIDPPLNSVNFGCISTETFCADTSAKSPLAMSGSELVFRIISFASPSLDQKVPTESPASSTQESKGDEQKISLRETLSNATNAMQSQILSRAFLGWLTYSQHLRKIRLNLATIVAVDGFMPNSDGIEMPVNQVFWKICRSEKTIILYKQFLTRVYFWGVEPSLRAQVWPYLLRLVDWHEDFGRVELDAVGETYRRDLGEWTRVEGEFALEKVSQQSVDISPKHFTSNGNGSMSSTDVFEKFCGVFSEGVKSGELPEKAFAKEFADNLLRIQKDVERCDRTIKFYSKRDNLDVLQRIICTYIYRRLKLDLEDGYVQGMCDLVAPLLVVFGDEALTLACFERMMRRMRRNFPQSTQNGGMEESLKNFRSLVEVMDPELYCQLMRNIDYSFVVFYRWLLLDFKRELVYGEVFQLWEVIWAAEMSCSRHFELFFGLALLTQYREVLIENEMDFTDVIKFFNEMAEKHNVDDLLNIARQKLQTFQEMKNLDTH
uniref:phosphorylase kinase n=1 Tax=Globodera rostochiensis TaxID=31243 RepID=A0A914HCA6_GLORO